MILENDKPHSSFIQNDQTYISPKPRNMVN